jgi:DNA-binding XRE family transcriptional regulator
MAWRPKKLTAKQLEERQMEVWRLLRATDLSQAEIAPIVGVSQTAIANLRLIKYAKERYAPSAYLMTIFCPSLSICMSTTLSNLFLCSAATIFASSMPSNSFTWLSGTGIDDLPSSDTLGMLYKYTL